MVYKLKLGTFLKKRQQARMIFRKNEWGNLKTRLIVFRKLWSHQGRRMRRKQKILLPDRCLSSYKLR